MCRDRLSVRGLKLLHERSASSCSESGSSGIRRRERKIRARIKRRINVDQIHLAGELGQQRGQDVLLVAPD